MSGERKAALAKTIRADETVNHKEMSVDEYVTKYSTDGKGFDCVFYSMGGPNLDASIAAAARRGKVATIASKSTPVIITWQIPDSVVFMVLNLAM